MPTIAKNLNISRIYTRRVDPNFLQKIAINFKDTRGIGRKLIPVLWPKPEYLSEKRQRLQIQLKRVEKKNFSYRELK
ncbi:hypothetical protein PI23P_06670 [Polaribacter irgensii 23-P]|uniref:Uncharacterized protein n=1 Tax=Polaribacter irgensii 23-P TaxID=313594 RepID=A4BYP3_9FLAO|nr:hypothetical protein PI23P_06670 [Polaribacter irgensii 23-P]